jgi:hypothetical protein
MAVSLPGFNDVEPYLLRELSLYDVPYTRRAGKSLGGFGVGRLFSLVKECASSSFSFDSLKALLFNASIPWKNPALNRDLVSFGINNHCVLSFTEKNHASGATRTVDVWEEAFKNAGGVELEQFYLLLKQRVSGMAEAKTFAAIRKNYFAFTGLLDMEKCPPESGAVLARCIEELSVLADLEKAYQFWDDEPAFSAFDFFVSHLDGKKYVAAPSGGGVNIYEYPVAAGAPFAYHFVLNAAQNAATVQYRPLKFLRQDKRNRLGLEDRDVSAPLFRLFRGVSRSPETWFSAAEKSFSGWAIPHSFFAAAKKPPVESPADKQDQGFFLDEKSWWAEQNGAFPRMLFPVQKNGFKRWSGTLLAAPAGTNKAGLRCAEGPARAALTKRIADRKGAEEVSVSATDLTEFFTCPELWLFERIFGLATYTIDAAMLDDRSLGNIYHAILRKLFAKIQEEDGAFQSAKLELYREWTREMSLQVIRGDKEFRGLLAWPLLENLAGTMARRISAMLATEATYFPGLTVELLEEKLSFTTNSTTTEGRIRFTGMLDRVSVSAQGAVIIDYKTGAAPALKDCVFA